VRAPLRKDVGESIVVQGIQRNPAEARGSKRRRSIRGDHARRLGAVSKCVACGVDVAVLRRDGGPSDSWLSWPDGRVAAEAQEQAQLCVPR